MKTQKILHKNKKALPTRHTYLPFLPSIHNNEYMYLDPLSRYSSNIAKKLFNKFPNKYVDGAQASERKILKECGEKR